jgi:hypothetical protein
MPDVRPARSISSSSPAALGDAYTRAHLEDLGARIRRTLAAEVEVPAGS